MASSNFTFINTNLNGVYTGPNAPRPEPNQIDQQTNSEQVQVSNQENNSAPTRLEWPAEATHLLLDVMIQTSAGHNISTGSNRSIGHFWSATLFPAFTQHREFGGLSANFKALVDLTKTKEKWRTLKVQYRQVHTRVTRDPSSPNKWPFYDKMQVVMADLEPEVEFDSKNVNSQNELPHRRGDDMVHLETDGDGMETEEEYQQRISDPLSESMRRRAENRKRRRAEFDAQDERGERPVENMMRLLMHAQTDQITRMNDYLEVSVQQQADANEQRRAFLDELRAQNRSSQAFRERMIQSLDQFDRLVEHLVGQATRQPEENRS